MVYVRGSLESPRISENRYKYRSTPRSNSSLAAAPTNRDTCQNSDSPLECSFTETQLGYNRGILRLLAAVGPTRPGCVCRANQRSSRGWTHGAAKRGDTSPLHVLHRYGAARTNSGPSAFVSYLTPLLQVVTWFKFKSCRDYKQWEIKIQMSRSNVDSSSDWPEGSFAWM